MTFWKGNKQRLPRAMIRLRVLEAGRRFPGNRQHHRSGF